jgi:hypothetical protein
LHAPAASHSRRILSGKTLTGQRENKAAVEVVVTVELPQISAEGGPIGAVARALNLEWGSAGEPGVDVVPPLKLVAFSHLPTKKHQPSIA